MVTKRTQVPLKCPTCGKTGAALINSSHEGKSASVIGNFVVKLTDIHAIKIACKTCDTIAYEFG